MGSTGIHSKSVLAESNKSTDSQFTDKGTGQEIFANQVLLGVGSSFCIRHWSHCQRGAPYSYSRRYAIAMFAVVLFWVVAGTLYADLSSSSAVKCTHEATKDAKPQNGESLGRYWLGDLDIKHGRMPWVTLEGYQFFRNVEDFGAKGDGATDDTDAINRAISSTNWTDPTDGRCGWNTKCGSSSTLGALVYFPPGTYLVSRPVIQYYYTQFVGDAMYPPTIKAAPGFRSSAMSALNAVIDINPYVPNEPGPPPNYPGLQWYINQNIFFRQVRNINIDLTDVQSSTGDTYGIHWQVSQATSLQNVEITMRQGATDQIGIFTENGSGGFVSDVLIKFGTLGWKVGSQQFMARAVQFVNQVQAIQMLWDWGFTWKNIDIRVAVQAIDARSYNEDGKQGVGSMSVIDSTFDATPDGITLPFGGQAGNVVLDNIHSSNSLAFVKDAQGTILVPASQGGSHIDGLLLGNVVNCDGYAQPDAQQPLKLNLTVPVILRDAKTRKTFERSKPQYGDVPAKFVLNVLDFGVLNDGTGDQSSAINDMLHDNVGFIIFFPADIYAVADTVHVPLGTKMVGEGWSQIMAYGPKFHDERKPRVMLKVGQPGDRGVLEIADFLFTVKGPTAGAILVEWNIHETSQGSAGMWDSHFRVGGNINSRLTKAECEKTIAGINSDCKAASMLMHLKPSSSGYFENIWGWTADHDIDAPINPLMDTDTQKQMINVFSARGMLIESQGPTWMYATAAEHNTLYQYTLHNAKNLYMAHLQTETPYFQPGIPATGLRAPFQPGAFPGDPETGVQSATGLRIINSSDIVVHGAGLYSFFNSYVKCSGDVADSGGVCQDRIFEIENSERIKVMNLYTVGSREIVSPKGKPPVTMDSSMLKGYSTEIGAYMAAN